MKDGAAKIWGQLVVGLLCNFKNRILGGWLSVLEILSFVSFLSHSTSERSSIMNAAFPYFLNRS